MRASPSLLVIVLLAVVFAGRLAAQEPKAPEDKKKTDAGVPKKDGKQPEIPFDLQDFWLKDAGVGTRGWVACLGQLPPAGGAWNPLGVLGARVMVGHPEQGLPEWKFVFDECLPLWPRYLDLIQDRRQLPDVNRKELGELRGHDFGMYLALVEALDRSHMATLDQFKKSAPAHDFVDFSHLIGTPTDYRGKIITIKGRISRVKKDVAPRHVRSQDLEHVYFTSIQGPFKAEPPFAVVFTELPAGVSYRDKLDLEVTFHGYFLAHVLFPGDPKRRERDVVSPYLVGKTLIVNRSTPIPADVSYSYDLIVWTVGAIVAILFLAVLLNFWFRRGDRRVESQLAQVRDRHHPFSVEPADPPPPPVAEPVQPTAPPLAEPVNPPTENGPAS